MDPRVTAAFADITAALEQHRQDRDDALRRASTAEAALDEERASSQQREASLVDANARLLAQVEELSLSVARAQAQVRGGALFY